MRWILIGTILLLASCQASTGSYYTQTIDAWRGAPAKNIVQRWGSPNQKIIERSGRQVWVYQRTSFTASERDYSPRIGVNVSGGRPTITQTNDINTFWNRELAMSCTVKFLINRAGTIIDSKILGDDCVFNEKLQHDLANPQRR